MSQNNKTDPADEPLSALPIGDIAGMGDDEFGFDALFSGIDALMDSIIASNPAVELSNQYGGAWGAHPVHAVNDWQNEVASNDTRLGYWDWVLHQIDSENNTEHPSSAGAVGA